MITYAEKHCVIGAGFSGLAVAAALTRHNIPYDQLEADSDLGGNWLHGVYETVHIISSRKTTEYSEYPMPEHYPDFPSAAQVLEYLRDYAAHYGLGGHIQFGAEVKSVVPHPGDTWEVTLASGEKRIYGGVIVCNGHHWDCRYPSYPGTFSGETMHSKQYKNPAVLRGKRVLVVGAGNSGCDIAVEAARFGAESHISIRRGIWILPQTFGGIPTIEYLRPWMRGWMQNLSMRVLLRLFVGPYSRYGLPKPDHAPFSRHPTINSQLLHALKHGDVKPHPDIRRLDGNTVGFVDGSRIEVDLIVYATGYHVSFPFVSPEVIQWRDGYPNLVGGVFPPAFRNLYVVGIGQPRYGAGPLLTRGCEMLAQCIEIQPKLKRPLGTVLARLGQKPPNTYLMDPHEMIRRTRRMARIIPRLPLLERLVFFRDRGPVEKKQSANA